MSEVKRLNFTVSQFESVVPNAPEHGQYVRYTDYAKLAAEAQALREEVEKAQNALAFTEQWHGVRYERLWHWAHAELDEEQKRRYFNIVANGTAEHSEPPTYQQQLCRMKHRYECAEKEVAALRARVAVVPDASTVYAALDARERLFTSPENIQVALEAQSRLNGLTVSEGLLRRIVTPALTSSDAQDRIGALEELRALLSEQVGGNDVSNHQ
ncbi:TPA: hypothetical protein ACGCBC_000818 [Pseudomonas aeruginosa]